MWKNRILWYNGKKDWGIRDEKNTLVVGILDIAADVYQNEKEITSIYAHKSCLLYTSDAADEL